MAIIVFFCWGGGGGVDRTLAEGVGEYGAEEIIGGLTGDWRRLHFEELYGLYASPNSM